MKQQTDESRVPDTDKPGPPADLPTKYLPDATDDEASRQGWWAYGYGFDQTVNPYSLRTNAGSEWLDGWIGAQQDDCG